ncbi:hypothetical protein F5Y15DRAFT_426217 [Xylariaceae sp. FL0016]|nr:hypothetical protein F5Y15DRAFT_426217 [Xylariaceae sp. FL0016]
MILTHILACLAATVTAAGTQGQAPPTTIPAGCAELQRAFPSKLFLPGSEVYAHEARSFWSNTELQSPGCVFRPACALDVSAAVRASRRTGTPFAVRGGGHMGVPGANSIGGHGVLVVMSALTAMEVSPDGARVTLGPGLRWGDVYGFLAPRGLAVAGGRLAPVGVPGLLLAGGVSFHGNRRGWAADNVVAYEVVLADGRVVAATAEGAEADLFWALKGGGGGGHHLGVVTRFTLRAFASGVVWGGVHTVSGEHMGAFLDAVAAYAAEGGDVDPRSHIVPMVIPLGPGAIAASVMLFYDGEGTAAAAAELEAAARACFAPFLALPALMSSVGPKTLAAFAEENAALVRDGISDVFAAGTAVGRDRDELLRGLRATLGAFLGALPALYAVVPPERVHLVSLDWQPIGAAWQAGSRAANPGGSPLSVVDPDAKGTYLAWALVAEWVGDEYDGLAMEWVESTTRAIEEAARREGVWDAFTYMGDAAGFQEVFPGYGEENSRRLVEVALKYDPEMVFQELWPGGFRL